MVDLIDDNKLKNTWYKRADFWKDKVKANIIGMQVINKHADYVILKDESEGL